MSPELQIVVREVMLDGFERFAADGAGDIEVWMRSHFLDRWYRFVAFGVTSRADLEALRVTAGRQPVAPLNPSGDELHGETLSTSVSLEGTALEGR